jgi:class 3 adenylate cyclase
MAPGSTFGYATADDGAYIAYRVDGDGPSDLVWQPDWPGNIDLEWQDPMLGPWLREMSSFARVITHDHRGVGLSSREHGVPTMERRVEDLLAVLRAVGARRPVLVGALSSGGVHALLAATRPRLPRAVVWFEPTASYATAPEYPWGVTDEEHQLEMEYLAQWGTEGYARSFYDEQEAGGNPMAGDRLGYLAMQSRNACTPDIAATLTEVWYGTDVRGVLGAVTVPTLLMVHEGRAASVEECRYLASQMPSAELVEMPGTAWTAEEGPSWVERVRDFVGVSRPAPQTETALATLMFTDIVASTQMQASMGDHAWKDLLARHHATVRDSLERHGGRENDTAGDGFYSTFEGPVRAIRCALDVVGRVAGLGLEVRAGVHTGECELVEGKPTGLAASIGARVAALAQPSEVVVSQTVKDLVAGSGLTFEDARGARAQGRPWSLASAPRRPLTPDGP